MAQISNGAGKSKARAKTDQSGNFSVFRLNVIGIVSFLLLSEQASGRVFAHRQWNMNGMI